VTNVEESNVEADVELQLYQNMISISKDDSKSVISKTNSKGRALPHSVDGDVRASSGFQRVP
jgi:hypothetical protein